MQSEVKDLLLIFSVGLMIDGAELDIRLLLRDVLVVTGHQKSRVDSIFIDIVRGQRQ